MQIVLDTSDLIARGKNREIFRHPRDARALIKVVTARRQHREAARGVLERWLKPSYTREFMSEISAVHAAHRRAPQSGPRLPIIDTAGLVSTNKGIGLVVERIPGEGDALAPTLAELIARGGFDATMLERLNAFVARIFGLSVVAEDLDPQNIVWDARSQSFVLVDGFGVKPVVPIQA